MLRAVTRKMQIHPPKSPAQTDVIELNDAADKPTPRRILQMLNNFSKQVHWVEQCRRIADKAHKSAKTPGEPALASFRTMRVVRANTMQRGW